MKRPLELMAEIQEKNAEIDAIAKLCMLLKQDLAEKDAEIERLKEEEAKVVKELQALARLVDSLIVEKDAEIERLKDLLTGAAEMLETLGCKGPAVAELRKAAQ